MANFRKQKLKATLVRTNKVYPLAKTGMVVCFVDPSTMVFGDSDAVTKALDARDGVCAQPAHQRAHDGRHEDRGLRAAVEHPRPEGHADHDEARCWARPVRSPTMKPCKKRLLASWYSMNFQHGVKFDLTISTGDTLCLGHALFALDGRAGAAQDERHRTPRNRR